MKAASAVAKAAVDCLVKHLAKAVYDGAWSATQQPATFTREAYHQALILDQLSSAAHELSNTADSLKQEELADAADAVHTELHNAARARFPLYPSPEPALSQGREWAKTQGFAP